MRFKKIIATLMTAVVLTVGFSYPSAAADLRTSVIKDNFNKCDITDNFVNTLSGTDMSFIGSSSSFKVISGDEAINGKSLLLKKCDFRWWAINKYDKKMYFGATFIFRDEGKISFNFGMNTQNPDTTDYLNAGCIFKIETVDNIPVLKNNSGKVVAAMEYGKKYSISAEFDRGSDKYSLIINGETVSCDNIYTGKVFNVINIGLGQTAGTIVIDDIFYNMSGTEYPQMYSTQGTAEMPEVKDFKLPDYKTTEVYVNDIKEPVITGKRGAKIKIDIAEFISKTGLTGSGKKTGKVSLSYIEDNYDAKIWYDEATNTVLITTGKFKDDGILRAFRGKLYMNGEQYYEISFNKFDLFWQVYASFTGEYTADYPNDKKGIEAAEDSLRSLHDNGLKTIRVFMSEGDAGSVLDPEKKEQFFKTTEKVFELCSKYDIKVVVCLGLISSKFLDSEISEGIWVSKEDTYLDLVANPDCASRMILETYLKEYISRFKDNPAVLMWEINNEGNLGADVGQTTNNVCYSALQLAEFYGWCADIIRSVDDTHLITTGDSILRGAQYHLLKSVAEMTYQTDWTVDSVNERRTILQMLNEKYDVISMHTYDSGLNGERGTDYDGKTIAMTMDLYMDDAACLGKPLYAGETNVSTGITDRLKGEDTVKIYEDFLSTYVDAGVQLTHWWAFHTDRTTQYDSDLEVGVREGVANYDEVLRVFREKNAELKSKYMINGYNHQNSDSKIGIIIAICLGMIIAAGILSFFIGSKKRKNKKQ